MSMNRLISAVVLIIVLTCCLNFTTGYKWETVKPGDKLPKNTIRLGGYSSYVGRIVYYNLILPAKVINSSYDAVAYNTNTKTHIKSKQFEVLTATEKCEWKYLNNLIDVPENVVRVGTAWNREPIYLGGVGDSDSKDIASILLTSNKFLSTSGGDMYALACADNGTWVDATPPVIPKNAKFISGNSFVARLVGPYSLIPASIRNNLHYCSSLIDEIEINSLTCQVLVGGSNSTIYLWKEPGNFERTPHNAVVQGRTERNEFIYVGRDAFKSLSLITFSEVQSVRYTYDVLVKM